ncbi:hypothetical protein JHK87_010394 [Glycine soja]|nr:hypothetical protein JHK87_010394 [Glycine soja]
MVITARHNGDEVELYYDHKVDEQPILFEADVPEDGLSNLNPIPEVEEEGDKDDGDVVSACFISNSDEMEFEDVVSAIDEDQLLQPDQLYFALPLSLLRHPLQPHEMAALAIKASSALMKTTDKCGSRRK